LDYYHFYFRGNGKFGNLLAMTKIREARVEKSVQIKKHPLNIMVFRSRCCEAGVYKQFMD